MIFVRINLTLNPQTEIEKAGQEVSQKDITAT